MVVSPSLFLGCCLATPWSTTPPVIYLLESISTSLATCKSRLEEKLETPPLSPCSLAMLSRQMHGVILRQLFVAYPMAWGWPIWHWPEPGPLPLWHWLWCSGLSEEIRGGLSLKIFEGTTSPACLLLSGSIGRHLGQGGEKSGLWYIIFGFELKIFLTSIVTCL